MERRFLAGLLALVLCTGVASAVPYPFEDLIDTWEDYGWPFDAIPVVQGHPFSYQHDVTEVFNAGDTFLNATLELDFTNDLTDGVVSFKGYIVWDNREYAEVAWDGNGFVPVGEVDAGQESLALSVDWLNDDGLLDVTIQVYNYGPNPATAYLDHSRLYGWAESADVGQPPIPEPVTFLTCGLAIAGLGRYVRRRMAVPV